MKTIQQILIHVSGTKDFNIHTFCQLCQYDRYSCKEIADYLDTSPQNVYYYLRHGKYCNWDDYKKCIEILKEVELKKQDYVKEIIQKKAKNHRNNLH